MDMNQQIDPSKLTTVEGPENNCKETPFYQLFEIKKLSALVSPNGKEVIMQVPCFRCASCGSTWKPEGE